MRRCVDITIITFKLLPFSIKKNSIQVVADLPFLADNTAQDHCLEKIQKDFSQLFGDTLGYPNEVHFIAHFQEKPF